MSDLLKKVIADGVYENNENFQHLLDKNIEAAIKIFTNLLYNLSASSMQHLCKSTASVPQ